MEKSSFEEKLQDVFFNESDSLILWATVLSNRIEEFSQDEVIDYIKDDKIALALRITFVQLYSEQKYANDNMDIISLLKADVPMELKSTIVTYMNFNDSDKKEILEALISSDTGILAYHALKGYYHTQPNEAYKISRNILKNYENATEAEIHGAVQVVALEISNQQNTKSLNKADKELLLKVAQDTFYKSNDPVMKDAMIFSLANANDIDALEFIINCPKVDNIMKITSVERNYAVLRDLLNNEPTVENIDFVVDCMKILPINQLEKPLLDAKTKISAKLSLSMDKEFKDVIQEISNNGVDANYKWEK